MAQYSPSLRQQKVALFAFVAATASFMMGVMLPVNLRFERASKYTVAPVAQKPQPSPPQAASPTAIASPSASASPSPQSSSEPQPQPLLSGLTVKTAIAQKVKGLENTFAQLDSQRFNYSIPEQFQGKTIKEVKVSDAKKVIALTFDDGPWPKSTEQILEILKEHNVKATFFWVGQALSNHREIAQKVVSENHTIANHTWSHRYGKFSREAASQEIEKTAKLIEEITGVTSPIFRPPGGVLDNGLVDYVFEQNYVNVMWSVDSRDWRSSSASIIDNVLKQSKSGGIVLMHDGGGNRSDTVKALPTIIKELKKQGYEFVTIPELLAMADQNTVEPASEPTETSETTP